MTEPQNTKQSVSEHSKLLRVLAVILLLQTNLAKIPHGS